MERYSLTFSQCFLSTCHVTGTFSALGFLMYKTGVTHPSPNGAYIRWQIEHLDMWDIFLLQGAKSLVGK